MIKMILRVVSLEAIFGGTYQTGSIFVTIVQSSQTFVSLLTHSALFKLRREPSRDVQVTS